VKLSERENKGWDLAAWKYGMKKYEHELSTYDYVILANNSCIYANNWRELLVGAIGYDMYGHLSNDSMVKKRYFLMSWFIIISKRLFNSSAFKEYFKQLNPTNRDYCIHNHEIRFMDYFKNKGYKIGLFAYKGMFGAGNGMLKKKERTPEKEDDLKEWMNNYTPKYTYH
jgi:lipopolysaccharide biosynthesis protein